MCLFQLYFTVNTPQEGRRLFVKVALSGFSQFVSDIIFGGLYSNLYFFHLTLQMHYSQKSSHFHDHIVLILNIWMLKILLNVQTFIL